MGADESKHQPVQTDSRYMCLVFKIPDKIQVINGSNQEYTIIQNSIVKTWEDGIQAVKRKCGRSVLNFKLKGLPFETGLVSQNCREIVCEILVHLHNKGWHHLVSTNLTYTRDWFTFIFIKQRPIEFNYVGYMSLSSNDKLQFVNLLSGTFDDVLEAAKTYEPGCYRGELLVPKQNNYELVLNGSPWNGLSCQHAEARYFLIQIFSIILCKHEFVCTMNIKRTEDTFIVRSKVAADDVKPSDFFIVSLRKTKKIQIYNASDELTETIHQLINETLQSRGIRIERKTEHSTRKVEFKFKFPNQTNSKTSKAFVMKYFVCKLLETMKAHGWSILTGFDMSRGLSNKSELLFKRSGHLANCKAFCVTPLAGDRGGRLALINAPKSIITDCTHIIKTHWHKQLKSHSEIDNIVTYQVFTLGGDPWDGTGCDAYHAHAMMCHLHKKFSEKSYKLVLTADVIDDGMEYDEGKSIAHDPNAWWFMHEPEFSLDGGQPWQFTTSLSSVSDVSPYLPSVNSLLRDDFKEPAFPDFSAHQGDTSPNAPQLYQPYGPALQGILAHHGDTSPNAPQLHQPHGSAVQGILAHQGDTSPNTSQVFQPYEPALHDFSANQGHTSPSAPQVYQPHEPALASNYSNEKYTPNDELSPPPSYESVMRQNGRKR